MSDQPIRTSNSLLVDAVSMGATITSAALEVNEAITFAVQAVWSAGSTPVGTFDLQASNEEAGTYTSVLTAPSSVSGNTGSLMINVERAGYAFIKVVYTRTSGSGTLNVRVNTKRA